MPETESSMYIKVDVCLMISLFSFVAHNLFLVWNEASTNVGYCIPCVKFVSSRIISYVVQCVLDDAGTYISSHDTIRILDMK